MRGLGRNNVRRCFDLLAPPGVNLFVGALESLSVLGTGHQEEDYVCRPK